MKTSLEQNRNLVGKTLVISNYDLMINKNGAKRLVDWVITQIDDASKLEESANEIPNPYGRGISGTKVVKPTEGERVWGWGRTSHLIFGTITTKRATTKLVNMFPGALEFGDDTSTQWGVAAQVGPGDSGTILYNPDNEAVGMVWAGKEMDTRDGKTRSSAALFTPLNGLLGHVYQTTVLRLKLSTREDIRAFKEGKNMEASRGNGDSNCRKRQRVG